MSGAGPGAATSAGAARWPLEILLACGQICCNREGPERLAALIEGDLDWEQVLDSGRAHGMLPIVLRGIERLDPSSVPGEVLESLEDHFEATAAHNRLLAEGLIELLARFDQEGVLGVPFKGPALAAAAYGEIGLRQFGDVDILVEPRQLAAAECILGEAGFTAFPRLGPDAEKLYRRSHYAREFVRYDAESFHRFQVEIHWSLTPAYWSLPFALDDIGFRLGSAHLLETTIPALAPEELLLALAIHGGGHCWERLVWLCDLAALVDTTPEMDWEYLGHAARARGAERILGLALSLATRLLEVRLPDAARHLVAEDEKLRQLADALEARLFAGGSRPPVGSLDHYRYLLALRERRRDRLQMITALLLRPRLEEYRLLPLPRALFFLYPPLRAVRVTLKFAAAALARRGRGAKDRRPG